MSAIRVRVINPDAVRLAYRGGFLPLDKGYEFDAHPAEVKILLASGDVEIVSGSADVRSESSARPCRSDREFATQF